MFISVRLSLDIASRHHLRFASHRHLLVLLHNLSTYGRRAFSVAGPAACNSLCDELREPSLVADSFRQLLKTRLFAEYYRAYSTLEVSHIMRYINLLTYLLTKNICAIFSNITVTANYTSE